MSLQPTDNVVSVQVNETQKNYHPQKSSALNCVTITTHALNVFQGATSVVTTASFVAIGGYALWASNQPLAIVSGIFAVLHGVVVIAIGSQEVGLCVKDVTTQKAINNLEKKLIELDHENDELRAILASFKRNAAEINGANTKAENIDKDLKSDLEIENQKIKASLEAARSQNEVLKELIEDLKQGILSSSAHVSKIVENGKLFKKENSNLESDVKDLSHIQTAFLEQIKQEENATEYLVKQKEALQEILKSNQTKGDLLAKVCAQFELRIRKLDHGLERIDDADDKFIEGAKINKEVVDKANVVTDKVVNKIDDIQKKLEAKKKKEEETKKTQ